jgi:hypothetical protein
MGQQETTMRATGSALRRMILVLAVAALMAAMMAVSAMPAMADVGGQPHVIPLKVTGDPKGTGADVLHCGTLAGGGTNVRNAEAAGDDSVHFSCN